MRSSTKTYKAHFIWEYCQTKWVGSTIALTIMRFTLMVTVKKI